MTITRDGLHLELGEIIRIKSESKDEGVYLQAVAPQDCFACALKKSPWCNRFICTRAERGDRGVYFVKMGSREGGAV